MRPLYKLYSPSAEDTDGLVNDATGATSPLTQLTTGPGDGLAHQINITSAANLSSITFTLTGTDADGVTQTEAVTGPNATTVESTGYFRTVTSIAISATLGANTVDLGWVDEFVTPTIPFNWYNSEASVRTVVTGTINYTAQQTFSPMRTRAEDGPFDWSDSTDTDLVSATTSQISTFDKPITGFRIKANSYSSTATLGLFMVYGEA
jgi:hypothetical protein